MSDRVSIEITDGVADVRMNRPDKLNALDFAMFQALVDTGDRLAQDRTVRAVVLSGEGRGFCAGLDTGSFNAMAGTDAEGRGAGGFKADLGARDGERITNLAQQAVYTWTEMPAPVIAAVHGVALGGGIQIALGCDLRIVAPDARMSVMEIRWGILPDMTGLPMLVRLVGLDVAKELAFTGRMVGGEEALRLGLATKLSDAPRTDALELAREIAGKNPAAIRGIKALLNLAGTRPLAESFVDESERMGELIGSPNQVEAIMAELEKRPAHFTD